MVEPPPVAPTLTELTTTAMVVRRGGTFRFVARADGESVARLRSIEFPLRTPLDAVSPDPDRPPRYWFTAGGEVASRVTLVDDGSGGDPTAGDGWFTSAPLVPTNPDARRVGSRYSVVIDTVAWHFPDTSLTTAYEGNDRLYLHVFDAELDLLPEVEIVELAPHVRRTDHVVSIALPREAPVTQPPPDLIREALNAWYAHVPWQPDFLAMYMMPTRTLHGVAAFFSIVHNTTEGIGRPLADRTEDLGVPVGLQGMMIMRGPPDPLGQYILLHELNHRWAVFLDPELGLTSPTAHWDGIDRDRTFGPVYNNLELYLMGLLPADSVLPARVGTNGVTIDDIVQRHGPRVPAWPDAPREFAMGTVLVGHRLLEEEELRLIDFLLGEFATESHPARALPAPTFGVATGGRGRIVTRIPASPR